MTIWVKAVNMLQADLWDYWYDERYNMLSATRMVSQYPRSTLQGAYNLIIKADTAQIISYFETVSAAEVIYWQVVPSLFVPTATAGYLLIAQDIDDGQQQTYFTDSTYSLFYTRLGPPVEPTTLQHVAIGQQVIVDLAPDGMLAGVWLLDLPPEIGQKHAVKSNALG